MVMLSLVMWTTLTFGVSKKGDKGLADDVPLKYTVTIREIYTTVKKAEVFLMS